MGWTNYVYFKDCNIAIEVGKLNNEDIYDCLSDFEEFIRYINSDNSSIEVINYLWGKNYIYDAVESSISIYLEWLGKEYDIISEDELSKLKDVKVLSR